MNRKPAFVVGMAALAIAGCGGKDNPTSGTTAQPSQSSANATTSTPTASEPATTQRSGTAKAKHTKPRRGCVPAPIAAPPANRFKAASASSAVKLAVPERNLDLAVTAVSSRSATEVASPSKKGTPLKASGGKFVLVTYKVKNNGRQPVAAYQYVPALTFGRAGRGKAYREPRGCPAGLYAAGLAKYPGRSVKLAPGATGTNIAAYVLPSSVTVVQWSARRAKRYFRLSVK